VLLVVAVILFSSLPAYIALWLQLEHQVWLRVQDAQTATQAIYEEETVRLKKMAGLIAERPTLYRLVHEGDLAALEPYLEVLKESANADVLQVITPEWQAGDRVDGLPDPQRFLQGDEPYFADLVSLSNPPRAYLVAVSQIQPSAETEALPGWVLLARELKDEQMRTLAEQTGLAQSLIVGGQRIATSLPEAPAWSLDPESASRVENTGESCCTMGRGSQETYYVGLMPLLDSREEVVALSEVALPGGEIRTGMLSTLAISVGISLLVMGVGALLVTRQARNITQPLQQLASAAEQASLGNLDPPGLPHSEIPEINQLARHLDRARRQLRQMLAVTKREMKHAEGLLSSVRQGVVALDENDRITFVNPDAEAILGYHAGSVLSQPYTRIFPPAPGETVTLGTLLNKPPVELVAERLTVLDAQQRPLLLSVSLSQLENDQVEGFGKERVLVIRDVTEEEAVNRLRYNFLANVAHEFRTPLAGIAATTELLVEEGSDLTPEELGSLLETISLSTLHLQTLVDNLLESTTIEAGVFQVHRRPIQLLDIVNKAADLLKPLLKRRDQSLTVSAPGQLPTLWADPNRLTQVLVNLLSNASKFSPMRGEILLSVQRDEDNLTISVLDSGPGLPADRFADLFNRFVTGSQPGETQYGIGLGLSVVKSIVEMHDGRVGAENRPSGGANVWFTLPIQPPQENEDL
jgi:NtrC-family two-component system sensor histidine kinase KinB